MTADDIYRRTYRTVAAKNAAHYERYPEDVDQARQVAEYLAEHDVRLPDGAPLTVAAFQSAGAMLGQSGGSHALHYLLEDPFAGDQLSDAFLYAMMNELSFATGPLYALLHEAAYAQGFATGGPHSGSGRSSRSSAPGYGSNPLYFTGEMIYPWMIDADPVLRPLREAADILAERDDWPPLYDPTRLAANEVPGPPPSTTRHVRGPRALDADRPGHPRPADLGDQRVQHDGLRVSNGAVLDRLIGMAAATSKRFLS